LIDRCSATTATFVRSQKRRPPDGIEQPTGADGETTGYDAAGNLLCWGDRNSDAQVYARDGEGRISDYGANINNNTAFLTARYTYDAHGSRVRSDQYSSNTPIANRASVGASNIFREYSSFNGQILAEKDQSNSWTDYIFANGRRIARIDPGNIYNYTISDHLGTAQMEFSAGGAMTWKGDFDPFGQELDTGATTNRYKFTGKERDAESGLDYFGARYASSSMGRFMSPDYSMNSVILELPQTWNKYSYVVNRPTFATDPDGRCRWCIGAIVGGVVEGGFDLGKQLYNNGGSLSKVSWGEVGANTVGGAVAGALAVATGEHRLSKVRWLVGDIAAGGTANVVGGVVTRALDPNTKSDDVLSAGEISHAGCGLH